MQKFVSRTISQAGLASCMYFILFHLVLFAQNQPAYESCCPLVSMGFDALVAWLDNG